MNKITLTQPDDWHLHVRNGEMLKNVLPFTARRFARAIIMPNLKPAVTTVSLAETYRSEILMAAREFPDFIPLMTLYLTDTTSIAEVQKVSESAFVFAFKLYPAGATTNSDSGVTDIKKVYPVLEAMQQFDVPLLVHGETTDSTCDVFDREKIFIEQTLRDIVKKFPELRIVLEHITTQEGVEFVQSSSDRIAGTITPQHLLYNRNALFSGGLRPHNYCLPVLKREQHQQSLIKAATSGNPKFFLGTDSAPHPQHLKENSCGCAGCFTAFAAIELYAEAFEQAGALEKLEAFASFYGPDFYGLPRNSKTIDLVKEPWTVPSHFGMHDICVVPLKANETIQWKINY